MITSTLLVDLYDILDKDDRLSVDDIATTAIMGLSKNIMNTYDSNKNYHKGDMVTYVTGEGELILITAIEDTSGTFDARKWEQFDIISELKNLYTDYIVLSWNKPSLRLNKVWLEIKNESIKAADNGKYGNTNGTLIYRNLIIDYKRPTMYADTIWGKIISDAD